MKKLALMAGAVLALSVMTAPAALAQDGTASCDAAKTKVSKLEKKLDDAAAEERVEDKAKLDTAQREVDRLQGLIAAEEQKAEPNEAEISRLKGLLKTAKAVRDDAKDKLDGDSQKVAGLRAQVDLAIQERDKACAPATTTPSPTPTPEPENDVDCDEVSGTEAQRILDEDRNDPNNLDQDGDGIACEIDEILPEADDDNDVVVNNNVAVPSGGIATGVGPRDS